MRWGATFAPGPNIVGAIEAVERNPKLEILLVGDRARLDDEIAKVGLLPSSIRIIESDGVVGMEEKPTTALREKPNCSIVRCWQLMAAGDADAVVSAGNTGAVVAAGLRTRLFLKGVKRPGIAVRLPTAKGSCVLMDVGANPAARA
jgi:glycerol-3-phosphate acyltransferase PlsX